MYSGTEFCMKASIFWPYWNLWLSFLNIISFLPQDKCHLLTARAASACSTKFIKNSNHRSCCYSQICFKSKWWTEKMKEYFKYLEWVRAWFLSKLACPRWWWVMKNSLTAPSLYQPFLEKKIKNTSKSIKNIPTLWIINYLIQKAN